MGGFQYRHVIVDRHVDQRPVGDDGVIEAFDRKWSCPDCDGDLLILRRGGFTASCENYPGCDTGFVVPSVVLWEPPADLYERSFYGQPIEGREYDEPILQCSLLEAASLADRGAISLDPQTVRDRGRAVEGDRFARRLRVYDSLRRNGVVPKTGYKFGADFRTYSSVESVDELGHSEYLVRVVPADYVFEPRDLSLDVRLAHGVRKTMVFALVDGDEIEFRALERLTP